MSTISAPRVETAATAPTRTLPTRPRQFAVTGAPRATIVILTHDGWTDTQACLESLAQLTYENFDIVIVDSGSTDDTIRQAREKFPQVAVIDSGANLGYAEGNNVGMRWALAHGADYVFVLNNDVILAADCLTNLIEAAEAEPRAALLGPLVYHFDEPRLIQSAGGTRTPEWQLCHRGQNEEDAGQFAQAEAVDWLTGCAVLAKREFLETVGFLDPEYFLYQEDVDWCLRAQEAGYHVLFVPSARLWHKGVQRDYNPGPHVTYYMFRNYLLLLKKHHANWRVMAHAWLSELRTLASWSLRPRWQNERPHRDALARALYDALLGRRGPSQAKF